MHTGHAFDAYACISMAKSTLFSHSSYRRLRRCFSGARRRRTHRGSTAQKRPKGKYVSVPDGLQPHILVIDRSPDILQLMRDILCGEGYRVSLFANLEHGIEEITSLAPALIIVDSAWDAGSDRWPLLERLRHDENTAGIPVILCTGAVREASADRKRLEALGIRVVLKPFDLDPFLMEISALVSERHLTPVADGIA